MKMEPTNDNNNIPSQQQQQQPATSQIQDLIGGQEKVELLKNKVESNNDNEPTVILRSSDVEDALYPKEAEQVTNNHSSYGD